MLKNVKTIDDIDTLVAEDCRKSLMLRRASILKDIANLDSRDLSTSTSLMVMKTSVNIIENCLAYEDSKDVKPN